MAVVLYVRCRLGAREKTQPLTTTKLGELLHVFLSAHAARRGSPQSPSLAYVVVVERPIADKDPHFGPKL